MLNSQKKEGDEKGKNDESRIEAQYLMKFKNSKKIIQIFIIRTGINYCLYIEYQ
jgi:hypothetical protein